MQQYQRFVDELAPRLETARALERQLDAHLARRFNVFNYLRRDELGLSRIVADLLNPEGKHGQGASFLKLLLDGCDMQTASPEARTVEVEVEKAITDNRRLDICVRIGGFCLAIENKPYAGDQPDQIRDYLKWLRCNYEEYALIYLSPSGEPPSPESVKPGDLKGLGDVGDFKIMPYDDSKESESDDSFDRCNYTLAEWFADCRKNCSVERLWWFLREAEEFCRRSFGGSAMGSSEVDTVKKFVVSDEKNWKVGLEISQALPRVMKEVSMNFIEKIKSKLDDQTEYVYPSDVKSQSDPSSARLKAYLGIYRESWKSAPSERRIRSRQFGKVTQIRLEAWREIDLWCIGIMSENPQLIQEDQEGHRQLRDALATSESTADWWGWQGWVKWQWVDERYRNWSAIIPALNRECEEDGGEATMYFVEKFARIAKVAIPIIDRYERT